MSPACVLFDLDGTLIDHFKAIHRCHTHAMTRLGLPAPTMAQVRAAVGGGLDEAIARLAGRDKVAAILPVYTQHFDATHLDDVELLPGAIELLETLNRAGTLCAVLTNKRGYASREVCDHLGLTPLLRGIFGVGDTPWLKPDPAFTRHALQKLGVPADRTLLVGDSPFDVQTARNAGLAFIGVTTGTHNAAELRAAGAERICTGLLEVARELSLA
ncbi:MAG: HAD family hydrolase [Verrucomicrobiota bacterium]